MTHLDRTAGIRSTSNASGLPLSAFLSRLIWICVLPLVVLASWLSVDNVLATQDRRDQEAANLARNVANSVDQALSARIAALNILAVSPLLDDPARWGELYREAQGFHQSFGTHVLLADVGTPMHMLFNTRVPFGTKLPLLPRPKGNAAAPTAIATGHPAVGDTFIGPIAEQPLIAIAVPALRDAKPAYLVLTILATQRFQQQLDELALPAGWSIRLLDGRGATIAQRSPDGFDAEHDVGAAGRFLFRSRVSPWMVVLEIPRDAYRAPLVTTALTLGIGLFGATLTAVLGATLASRRLGHAVNALARPEEQERRSSRIREIAQVRRRLTESAQRRDDAVSSLHASEARFESIFEQAAVGIAQVSLEGHWIRVNDRLCAIVGYEKHELMSLTFQDITHPHDLDTDLGYLSQMLAREIQSYSMEKRYRCKDGSIVWVDLTVALTWKADGSPDYFISVIQDIQSRKEAEAALDQRTRELNAILSSVRDYVYILDNKGQFVFANQRLLDLWGLSNAEVFGKTMRDLNYPETVETTILDGLREVLRTGQAVANETHYTSPTGISASYENLLAPMRGPDGTVTLVAGSSRDITERKRAEQEIRRLNLDLERRVSERTAELSAANQELEAFAYAVSHDLRAPLRAMSGFSQALIEDVGDQLTGDARMYLEQIQIAVARMTDLIDGLLTLSRSTRGELRREPVDLSGLARRLLAELTREAPEQRVTAEVQSDIQVVGDPRMIEAVMRNLLDNAMKYSAGAPAPRILVYREHRDGRDWVCVEDNGAGFNMDYANKLFEPFQRLHRQEEFPGLGIGLATVQRIVHRHGGLIEARGESGRGATFRVSLSSHAREAPKTVTPTQTKSMT